jgi:hypothetical protein
MLLRLPSLPVDLIEHAPTIFSQLRLRPMIEKGVA